MARKKHSMVKATMFITLTIILNFVGISYGYWQDGLTGKIRVSTGYIQPGFEADPRIKMSSGFNSVEIELNNDYESKIIEITGAIENGAKGEFQLDYTVINNGSLPIKFDDEAFEDLNQQVEGLTILEKPSERILYPNDNTSDSITIQIDSPEVDIPEANTPEADASQVVGEYDFEIMLPYRLWVD